MIIAYSVRYYSEYQICNIDNAVMQTSQLTNPTTTLKVVVGLCLTRVAIELPPGDTIC